MRELIVTSFISADGVMEAPGGGDHPHAGWTFTDIEFVPEAYELKGTEQEQAGAIMMGRISYEEFAPVWHTMEDFTSYNAGEKYVVSRTLTGPTAAWGDFPAVRVLRSVHDVETLKQTEGGSILVHGSATLARSLARAGLVDRYHLLVFPVLLGSGKRLFADAPADKQRLALVDTASYRNGVTKLVYDVLR